jgi:protease II
VAGALLLQLHAVQVAAGWGAAVCGAGTSRFACCSSRGQDFSTSHTALGSWWGRLEDWENQSEEQAQRYVHKEERVTLLNVAAFQPHLLLPYRAPALQCCVEPLALLALNSLQWAAEAATANQGTAEQYV